jgi:hypothetical protein
MQALLGHDAACYCVLQAGVLLAGVPRAGCCDTCLLQLILTQNNLFLALLRV